MGIGDPAPFGALLRRHRKVAELTQEELAERAHLSVRGISDLERGARRSPRSDTLALLVEALGLTGPARAEFAAAARQGDEPEAPRPVVALPLPLGRPALPSLVGREQEWAALERFLTAEGPPVFLLAGEPGIGKTRLLKEVSAHAPGAGLSVLSGSCQRRGDQMPYAPLLGALQAHVRDQSPAQLRADLEGCSWLVRLLPELATGPIEPLPQWLLAPDQEQRLMGQAVERFLSNIAGPAGTLLVLDDLQWAGRDALTLLTDMIHSTGGDRLRLVGAYRETEIDANDALGAMLADLAQAGLATQRRLGPLTPEEATDLLSRLLPEAAHGGEPDIQLRERLLSRADGVPFFLVSCAQALREGALDDGVPWDVAQGVRQRVAALGAAAQAVLGVASVAGRIIPRSLLLRVTDYPEEAVLSALEAACRSGLLAEHGEYDYEIPHDVIREVVEADLGAARRTALHRQIALVLTSLPGEPPAEEVAYHFARTGEHGEAAQWLERAGDAAAAQFATATALDQYRAARQRAAAAGMDAEHLSRLEEKLGDLYVMTGESSRAREAYAAALAYVGTGTFLRHQESAGRRAELLQKEGDAWEKQGEYARALATFDLADAEGGRAGTGPGLPDRVRAAIELSRGTVYQRQGNNDAATAAVDRAVELLSAESPTGPAAVRLARAINLQGNIAFNLGDLARAEALYRQGLSIRERLGDQWGTATSWNSLGRIAFRRADLDRAGECFQRALDAYERIGDRRSSAGGWHNLGAVARDRGDLTRAEDCYRRCLAISERVGDAQLIEHSWHSLGIVAHDRGDLAQAEECFERSLEISDRIGDLITSAHTWHQLGGVARDRGDLRRAEECVQRSRALFERLGDETGRADCWTTLGLVAGERGDLILSAWWCRGARRLARRLGVAQTEAIALIGQARARLRADRILAASALLDQAYDLATAHDLPKEATQVMLARAELQLRRVDLGQDTIDEALASADEGLSLATRGGYRREMALARRLLGRCALARSLSIESLAHLDAALAMQTEMGAELEAARTRMTIVEATTAAAQQSSIPPEAPKLLAQAREAFLSAGAAHDLREAKRLAVSWTSAGRAPGTA